MPRHLDSSISCLSKQDKEAFIVFGPFNRSEWPGQQGIPLQTGPSSAPIFFKNYLPFFSQGYHSTKTTEREAKTEP